MKTHQKHNNYTTETNQENYGCIEVNAPYNSRSSRNKPNLIIPSIIITLAFALTACKPTEDQTTPAFKAKSCAKAVKKEIHQKYLSCYALNEQAKKQCVDDLAAIYVERRWQGNTEYIQIFQFECEKLGFKEFLENLGLPCESIKDGPKFREDKNAYEVICQPKGRYFMQFDYESKNWQVL